MKTPFVQIVILTHDRPEMLIQCVRSALSIDYPNFSVTVSDNSTAGDNRTEKALASFLEGHPKYIRRTPTDTHGHGKIVLDEMTAQYCVIFHDDDLFEPDFLKDTMEVALRHPELAAVGTNMYHLWEDGTIDGGRLWMHDTHGGLIWWDDPRKLLDRMAKQSFHLSSDGFAMVSGHLYNRKLMGHLRYSADKGGKYNDMAYLTEVCQCGPIAWLMKPLWHYRHHGKQDSFPYEMTSAMSFLDYYIQAMGFNSHSKEVEQLRKAMTRIDSSDERRLRLEKTCVALFKILLKSYESIVLYPAGQHTHWLLERMNGLIPLNNITVCDDKKESLKGFEKTGMNTKLLDECNPQIDTVILSSDNQAAMPALEHRLNSKFGDSWLDVYELLRRVKEVK